MARAFSGRRPPRLDGEGDDDDGDGRPSWADGRSPSPSPTSTLIPTPTQLRTPRSSRGKHGRKSGGGDGSVAIELQPLHEDGGDGDNDDDSDSDSDSDRDNHKPRYRHTHPEAPLRGRHERGRLSSASSAPSAPSASDSSDSSAPTSASESSDSYEPNAGRRRRHWPYAAAEERAVVRKFDRQLVLFVALLYMLSFVDRSNIGNARVAGMDEDLQTTPRRDDWYAWALSAFYAAYIAFEWMALLWRVLPAHAYVTALVASWGAAASLQAVAGSYPVLVVLRALLGVAEAGFAGIPLYLARFFRRDELALRTAVFLAAAPLATSFAASLAWTVLALARRVASPIAPWRLLFLVEGFPSVVAAAAAWRRIPDAPERAPYLTRRERRLVRRRLEGEGDNENDEAKQSDLAVLADPVAWLAAAMFFLTNMAYSSLPVFLPTILAAMGHDAVAAQALAAPPYLVAAAVVLATAHVSDRAGARAPLLVGHALASAAGYGVLSLGARPSGPLARTGLVRYVAVYPAAAGFFSVVVLLIAWNLNNQRGARRRGGAFALFQAVGQCGPLVGTRLYPDADAPLYRRGMRTMAVAMLAVAVLGVVLRAVLQRRNRKLAAARDEDEDDDDANDDDDSLVRLQMRPRGGQPTARRQRRATSFRYML